MTETSPPPAASTDAVGAPTAPAPAAPPPAPAPLDTGEGAEYKVNLEIYSGPLELLLYLIRRDEVDIKDIPIARITEQYLKHVEIIRTVDINLAGEFLVMAATLMEIKSRMLIPKKPATEDPNAEGASSSVEDLTDPRYELVKQLLAYKEFKDAATDLKRRAETESDRYPRAVPKPTGKAPLDIEDLDLFRLIDAFNAIMASVGHSAYGHEVVYDDTPISMHQVDILDRLSRESKHALTLQDLFVGRTRKSEMIGLFLATLELIRQKKIAVEQTETLGVIQIRLRDDAPEQTLFQNEAPVPPAHAGDSSEAPVAAAAEAAEDAAPPEEASELSGEPTEEAPQEAAQEFPDESPEESPPPPQPPEPPEPSE